jgi:hypothetical protein
MLKVRLLTLRRLHVMLAFMLAHGLISGISVSAQTPEKPVNYCVQAVNVLPMFGSGVLNVVTVDVKIGQAVAENRPIATPDALFSPDRNYAIVWKALSQPKNISFGDMELTKIHFGLYLVTVQTNHAVLLDSVRGDEFVSRIGKTFVAWSPDGSKVSFISKKNERFFINVINAQGNKKQTKQISAPKGTSKLTNVHFYGWSADSLYIATAAISGLEGYDVVSEMNIWEVSKASLIYSSELALGYGDRNGALAWAPTGHRLAVLLDTQGGQKPPVTADLVVWSPEHGIEAQSSPVTLDDDYYDVGWSPKERHVWVMHSGGHSSRSIIFGNTGSQLVKVPLQFDLREIVGWTPEDNALVLDEYVPEWHTNDATAPSEYRYEFSMIDAVNQSQKIIETDVNSVLSRDKTKILLYRQDTPYSFKIYDVNRNQSVSYTLSDPSPERSIDENISVNNTKTWSPDGTYIISSLYHTDMSTEVPTLISVDFINPDTSTLRRLQVNQEFKGFSDYRRLGFAVEWVNTHWILYAEQNGAPAKEARRILMDLQTDERILLKVLVEDRALVASAISPVGSTIAITGKQAVTIMPWNQQGQFQHQIPAEYVYVHRGGQIIRPDLHHTDYYDFDWAKYVLAWLPDSSALAFMAYSPSDVPELIVVTQEGKELLRKPMLGFVEAYVHWVECN